MEKIKFMTDEILTSVKPDVSILETMQSKKYLNELYANKGKVLCVPSPHSERYEDKQSVFVENRLIYRDYIESGHVVGTEFFSETAEKLMNILMSLPMLTDTVYDEDRLVEDFYRVEVEHNPQYWQLVVCGLIKVKDGILVLRNKDTHPRLPNLITMVQGHAEPSPEMHFMTSLDYLTLEFAREVVEEIHIPRATIESICDNSKLLGAVQVNTDAVAMEHLGLVFMLDLSNMEDMVFRDIGTNEFDKHELVLLKDVSDMEGYKLDSWAKIIINEFLSDSDWK